MSTVSSSKQAQRVKTENGSRKGKSFSTSSGVLQNFLSAARSCALVVVQAMFLRRASSLLKSTKSNAELPIAPLCLQRACSAWVSCSFIKLVSGGVRDPQKLACLSSLYTRRWKDVKRRKRIGYTFFWQERKLNQGPKNTFMIVLSHRSNLWFSPTHSFSICRHWIGVH